MDMRHAGPRLAFALLALVAVAAARQPELVIVKEGTTLYHRPGCPVVGDGVGILAMTRGQAELRGFKPHADCDPSKAPAAPAAPEAPRATKRSATPAKPAPTVYVIVDAGADRYHREGCPRIGKNPKKLALDAAAKKYWPCPVCRPPIRKRKS